MLRISVTTIDRFRQYIDEDKFFGNILVTEEKLLDGITGEFIETPQMGLGTAFHECLEKPQECYDRFMKQADENQFGFMSEKGIVFPYDIITKCYETIDYNFPFEIKKTKIYDIGGEQIEVVAKVDQWQGHIVNEHKTNWGDIYLKKEDDGTFEKTTGETFNWKRYYKACQWKYYLDVFNAERVKYKVFELAIDKTDYNQIKLVGIHQFEMYPYEDMENYIRDLLTQFTNYIHFRKLEEYFKPKENQYV